MNNEQASCAELRIQPVLANYTPLRSQHKNGYFDSPRSEEGKATDMETHVTSQPAPV
jgi:hypothetical protein